VPLDDPNPYAPPEWTFVDRGKFGDPPAETLRRAHLREESYAKALALANCLYVFLFGSFLISRLRILISHLIGRARSPWILQPRSIGHHVITLIVVICSFAAAWGFFSRRRWALRFELLAAISFALGALFEQLVLRNPVANDSVVAQAIFYLIIALPMTDALHLRHSVIFDPKYSQVREATRHIRVWPKLSLAVTLIEFALIALGVLMALQRSA
jgi:hypothetical protein